MNRNEFIEELERSLAGLPREEIDDKLAFYGEMIDDRMDDGISEEDAVRELGDVKAIARQITAEVPLIRIIKESVTPDKKTSRPGNVVLTVLASPFILILAAVSFALLAAFYAVMLSAVIALWSAELALASSGLALMGATAVCIVAKDGTGALFCLGGGLLCLGLSIFLFFGCLLFTKAALKACKKSIIMIKFCLTGRASKEAK